ncbi:MAG: TonB-dependent receptor, partial [Flammeovirgaceae bacterium]
MTRKKTFVFGYCLLLSFTLTAQSIDSVRLLQEVVVEQSRLGEYAISRYTLTPDSAMLGFSRGGNLADLLRKNGFGGIRSYGPGGLASASFRGSGSNHTNVLWNGINIISPLAGQTDLSQLPVTFFDDASVQTGGSASLYGNGSIGATVSLNNTARFNQGLTTKTFSSIGSFGYGFQDAALQWSGKKFISSTKAFIMQAENNFTFHNKNVNPARTDTRLNNAARQYGVLQQNYWQLAPRHMLWAKFWFQNNHYEVPNTSLSNRPGEATQKDISYRSLLGYSWSGNQIDFTYQGAFVQQSLDFRDPALNDLTSSNVFYSLIQNAEVSTTLFSTGRLTSGVH